MNSDSVIGQIGLIIMIFALGIMVGFILGIKEEQRLAIKAGVARHVLVDEQTGKTKFEYIVKGVVLNKDTGEVEALQYIKTSTE